MMRTTGILFIALLCLLSAPARAKIPEVARIEVIKSERRMTLFDKKDNIVRTYKIALGKSPVGDKEKEGDNRTPEGKYVINARNENSDYYLSLRLSYPNASDLWRAKKMGLQPGSNIFIHGMPNGKGWMTWKYNLKNDWTNGCIAVANKDMDELWNIVPTGTPIIIRP